MSEPNQTCHLTDCPTCAAIERRKPKQRLEATIARLRKRVKGLRQALRNEQKFNRRLSNLIPQRETVLCINPDLAQQWAEGEHHASTKKED